MIKSIATFFEFVHHQVFNLLYSVFDAFLPQKKFLMLAYDVPMYNEMVQCTKLSSQKDDLLKSPYAPTESDDLLQDYGHAIEFKNIFLTNVQVSSYNYSPMDIYRYCMRGNSGFIVSLDSKYSDLKLDSITLSDLIKYSKIDDFRFDEKKPIVYNKKNHRPILFILRGSNDQVIDNIKEVILKRIEENEYEKDKYFICHYDHPIKESFYEGLEWFYSKQP